MKRSTVCGTSRSTTCVSPSPATGSGAAGRARGAHRQRGEERIEPGGQFDRGDVTDGDDLEAASGEEVAGQRLQAAWFEPAHAGDVAALRPAIGVAGKGRGKERVAADHIRVLRLTLQAGDHLRLDPRHGVGVEARRVESEAEQFEGDLAMLRQGLELAVEIVTAGVEGEIDRVIGEAPLEGLGIEIAGTLVEQAGDQVGAAGGVRRVAIGAAIEGEFEGEQRQAVLLDQPGLDAAGGGDALDRERGARSGGDGSERTVHRQSSTAARSRPKWLEAQCQAAAGRSRPVTERSGLR